MGITTQAFSSRLDAGVGYARWMRRPTRWDLVGAASLLAFGVCFVLLWRHQAGVSHADAQILDPSAEIQTGEEWMGLYYKDEKVGLIHVAKQQRADGGYRFEMRTLLRTATSLDVQITAGLAPDLTLERFTFLVETGPAQLRGKGEVDGRAIDLTVYTGGDEITRRVELEHPPVLRTNLGPLLSRQRLEPGARFRYQAFDPLTQADQAIDVEVIGPDSLLIMGQETEATRLRTTVSGMRFDAWMNQRGEMLKQEMSLGLVAIRETEEQARWGLARTDGEGPDLANATRVAVEGLPKRIDDGTRLSLRFRGVPLDGFQLDGGPRQRFEEGVVHVKREVIGPGAPLPVLPGDDAALRAALASDGLIQSGHPRLRGAAHTVVGDASDSVAAARLLARWVHAEVRQTPVTGVPSALETLDKRVGDCNEVSTLFAGLARSLGVPTRIVVGLVYRDGHFAYHAWNEVWTRSGWLSVDATWNQMPADVGHVRFVAGGLDRQVDMLRLIGRLEVEVVDYAR